MQAKTESRRLSSRTTWFSVKAVFKGADKNGTSGLVGRAKDLKTAPQKNERLYFVEPCHGHQVAKANDVTDVINPQGAIRAPAFGAWRTRSSPRCSATTRSSRPTSAATPPYEKMKEAARICFKQWHKSGGGGANRALLGRALARARGAKGEGHVS